MFVKPVIKICFYYSLLGSNTFFYASAVLLISAFYKTLTLAVLFVLISQPSLLKFANHLYYKIRMSLISCILKHPIIFFSVTDITDEAIFTIVIRYL